MTHTRAALQSHNDQQIAYFERTLKRTMVPNETPYVRRQVSELIRFAELRPGQRVLEVGCGMGRYTLPLARRGINVEGLDIAPGLLEKLHAYAGDTTIPLHCMDVIDCSTAMQHTFDAVIGFFTLHHLHDMDISFQAMARLLKPGGRIAFLEPNAYNPLYYLQIALTPRMTWQGDRGVKDMRRGLVFRAVRRAGLTNCKLERFGFFPPFLANRSTGARVERVLESIPLWRPLLPFQLFGAQSPA
jgi:2-polyprenyl-3-methyl-5-hydroxy-6-metoxy-1,4-benzoquinol methylase